MKTWNERTFGRRKALLIMATACFFVAASTAFEAQFDLCGCASMPGLLPFDSADPATFPPGMVQSGENLTFQIPPDGVIRFSSFKAINRHISFGRNAANSPVQILVAGDFLLQSVNGCCYYFTVAGGGGGGGNSQVAGQGGLGGPGGFRGGDGASLGINGAMIGGTGFGAAGGAGATATPFVHGSGGTFVGVPELTPLIGGSGGGGGSSSAASPTSCSAGGGGGGGGGLLIVANGALTIVNYQVFADGGPGAGAGNGNCATAGGGGSGGAIRLVASRFSGVAVAELYARGGGAPNGGSPGRIRIESVDTSSQTNLGGDPTPLRIVGPTPIAAVITPTVVFATVSGNPVPVAPQGTYGGIDVVLPAPGSTRFLLNTTGVPSGTTILVTVKPRIGAPPLTQTVPLTNCAPSGACDAIATFTLPAGAYVAEARATFQVQ